MTVPLPDIRSRLLRTALWTALLAGVPLGLAVYVLGLAHWDLSIPLLYNTGDAMWQFTLTKALHDTGWVLTVPSLGAPETAHWHYHAAAQTSALHSVLMLALSPFIPDAVQLQQVYYLLNFPLICLTSFVACRLLGIARLPAFCAGLLFAFTTFRIGVMMYAFLVNYFMVPLALVPVIWILSGRFAAFVKTAQASATLRRNAARLLWSRDFALGLFFVMLTAASDGYYAFFTLLLLAFAAFARVLLGDWRRPLSLLPAAIYIVALVAVSIVLQLPLHNYKQTHRDEFYPNGIKDPVLVKQPFEAEIYSTTLKTIIAPIPQHHIKSWGDLGLWMIETSEAARSFKNGPTTVPLGTLGSALFMTALVLLAVPALRRRAGDPAPDPGCALDSPPASRAMEDALLSLALFIFLFSIIGGLGTLVALVFPTIRAYDRFPLFLIFVLLLGGARFMTLKLQNGSKRGRAAWAVFLLLVTAAALYDQIPNDARKGNQATKTTFLAERRFVQKLEAVLPPEAMVYQYPYSNYMRNSKYYGWSSMGHIRLYLHSHRLHWSNGGAKNSPADDWNFRVAQQPPDNLLAEVEAMGFSGFVIDRTVVKAGEYENLRKAFAGRGYEIEEDIPSKFAFVRLRDPGFRLVYEPKYREVDRIVLTDPARILAQSGFPDSVEGEALKRFVSGKPDTTSQVIRKADHPEIFADNSPKTRGLGQAAIIPVSDMRGTIRCAIETNQETGGFSDTLLLTVENQSAFDWKLGEGPFPIRIGVHLRQADGKLLRWDDGFRVPADVSIKQGTSRTIRLPLNILPPLARAKDSDPLIAEFALVQDNHTWFDNISCTVPLR